MPEPATQRQVPAALVLVQGLDEEGGMVASTHLSDSVLVAFFRDHSPFADARLVADYLAPGARVQVTGGRLTLDSVDTGIPVETQNGVSFVAVQSLASRLLAYARIREAPDRMITLWRSDILCRYAHNADRRAGVFLEAAEQGLLRSCLPPISVTVRRWSASRPGESWAASVTLRQPLDSATAGALLERYGARPYAAYGGVVGHHLIVRVPTDSASPDVFRQLNVAGADALRRAVCGLPDVLQRRSHGTVIRPHVPGVDAFHGERHMLASVLAARRTLPGVRKGAAIIHGFDVVGNAANLRRLATDSRILRFDAATKLDDTWVLPGTDMSVVAGFATPPDIAGLDSVALFNRLAEEAVVASAECRRN